MIRLKTRGLRHTEGFALIVTLSLMILLTVIAVGLLTLSSISLRSSSQGGAAALARANARVALMLAIGELQKHAGPDQRITARADILGDTIANPRLTGVWKSWEIKATSPPSPTGYEKAARNDKFLGWLTSGSDGKSAAAIGYASGAMPTDATKSVLLWGEKPFGQSPVPAADLVRAEKIATRGTGSSKGALAWAVMDEGIKVRINTPQHATAATVGEKIARLGSGQRPRSESLAALDGLGADTFEIGSSGFGSIRKGITRLNMGLVFEQLAAGADEALAPLLHDVSGVSQGMFVDVARGGLKRDFQLMTNSETLPSALAGQGVYESQSGLKNGQIKSDPTWVSLSEYARIYQSDGLSNPEGPVLNTRWPRGWQVAVVDKNATTNLVTLKNLNLAPPPGIVIAPVIEKVQMLFSLVGRELYESNGNSIHSPQGPNWKGTPYIYELGFLFTHSLSAQEQTIINCRSICLQGSKVPPALIAVASKDDGVAFKVSSDSFSPPVACPAIDRVVTFVSAGDKSPAAVATIPAGVTNAILLFLDSGSDKAANPWRVFVIDDSSKKIPDGGAFVANFYNHDIRFIIGENKITLKPGGTTSVKMPQQRNGFNMAEVLFQFQQGKDWVTPTQTMMQFAPGMRYLFFAFVDRLGQPRMSPYQDTFQPPPLQKPTAAVR